MTSAKKQIAGIGSALVDILSHENDDFLKSVSDIKGGMTLVDNNFVENTASRLTGKSEIVPGGAACNTIGGVARLGGKAKFIGKRGEDKLGRFFEEDLIQCGVETALITSSTPTGKVLSIITPDAQRSMFTYLGASSEMMPSDIADDVFDEAGVVLVEGYLLFNPDLIMTALDKAKRAGTKIALDLASFNVVEESRELLDKIAADYIDILIANEDEAKAFTGHSNEGKAIEAMSRYSEIAVLKVGKRGSYIKHNGTVTSVNSFGNGDAIDTTGAGDLWAAGFLYGFVNGFSMEKSGMLGSACGYEVCQVVGANIPDEGWNRISKLI